MTNYFKLIFLIFSSTNWYYSDGKNLSENIDFIKGNFALENSLPLILTPYLEQNRINEARDAAVVAPFIDNIRSYAGYFTVDKRYDSNLFFWYFPAEQNPESAPVVVWLQGGPGASSMFGLFREIGPYKIGNNKDVEIRDIYWSKTMHLIFIDNPVGTGFSFTNSTSGYLKDEESIGSALYSMLLQFFNVFPELQENDFYVAGESYAGKYVPAVCYTIHKNNPSSELKINLKGMAIGDGISDPVNQLDFGIYLYEIGLIDGNQKKEFDRLQKETKDAIEKQNWLKAYNNYEELIFEYTDTGKESLFKRFTGFHNHYNFLTPKGDSYADVDAFLNIQSVQNSLHVKSMKFQTQANPSLVANYLNSDFPQSVAPWVSILLDNYEVLTYNGQLDIIVAYPLTINYLNKLNWCGAEGFASAERQKWKVDGELAGYITISASDNCNGSLTSVLVRDAGHMVPSDQPLWIYSLISNFTSN